MRIASGRVTIQVQARPGAGRNQIIRVSERGLVVAINAPAEKGKANEELMDFLAREIGVQRSSIEIARGANARLKLVQIAPAMPEAVAARIRELAGKLGPK
jgi:uncharacterized protein (TIGR00251 family)